MTQINFDPTKPATGQRFRSEEVRENFQALSRANDLRCSEQDPPDLTIRVEAGAYAITSNETKFFAGGNSDPVDTTTGGTSGQQRIFVLEIDSAGDLQFNTGGAWATPPAVPVAPNYTADRIPLCEITVTFGDTKIVQSQIVDVRPMINLGVSGATGGLVSPGKVTQLADELGPLGLGAGNGQADFKTTSSFTYFPGQNELLVFSGGIYQTCLEDYLEIDSETIRFLIPRPDGERVTIWKVGLSATPGSIGLADLSDVDGNEAAAFNGADSPTAVNPFLTLSGHDAIDHSTLPSLVPFASHLVTTATNSSHRHHASEIEATDNFTFTNATDVQAVLDDIEANIYLEFLDEHNADGTHGPKITITQTNDDNALAIVHNGGNSTAALRVEKTSGIASCIGINNTGGGESLSIVHAGTNDGVVVTYNTTGSGNALTITTVSTDSGAGQNAIEIAHNRPDSSATVTTTPNFGHRVNVIGGSQTGWAFHADVDTATGRALDIDMGAVSTNSAIVVIHNGDPAPSQGAVRVNVTNTAASNPVAILVNQSGDGAGLRINKPINGPEPGIKIQTNATGVPSDIEGTDANWSILPTGTGQFANVVCGGGTGAISGFLVFEPGADLTVDSTGGISVTRSFHRVDTFGGAGSDNLDRIETSGIPDGAILVLESVADARDVTLRDAQNNLRLAGNFTLGQSNQKIMLIKRGSDWHELSRANN